MQTCVLIFDMIMNERVLLLRYLYLKEPFKYCLAEKTNIPNFTKTISAVPKIIFPLQNVAYSLQHPCAILSSLWFSFWRAEKKPVEGLSKPGRQGSLPTIAIGLPTTKAACPPPGLCPYQYLLPPTCCVTLQQTPKTNTQIYMDSNTQILIPQCTGRLTLQS